MSLALSNGTNKKSKPKAIRTEFRIIFIESNFTLFLSVIHKFLTPTIKALNPRIIINMFVTNAGKIKNINPTMIFAIPS